MLPFLDQTALMGGASQLINNLVPNANLAPQGNSTDPSTFIMFAIRAVIFAQVLNWSRYLWDSILLRFNKFLYQSAYIPFNDPAYRWVQAWVASDPSVQSQFSDFTISAQATAVVNYNDQEAYRYRRGGQDEGHADYKGENASFDTPEVVGRILPLNEQTVRITFNGRWIWVTKIESGSSHGGISLGGSYRLRTIGNDRDLIKAFIGQAYTRYHVKDDHEILIFHNERDYPSWREPISRPSRPWSSVILPKKDIILKDMQRFLSDKECRWYGARGIPHRRGYLFHGEPGAGKTTLVSAIASRLKSDIYVISLSQNGMDDNGLGELFRLCPAKSIILLEDIDRIFSAGKEALSTGTSNELEVKGLAIEGVGGLMTPLTPGKLDDDNESNASGVDRRVSTKRGKECMVTLSGLLNAIDGVSSQEGCLLIASTNHPDKLDPALSRAGRFDVRVAFHSATPIQAEALFLHFFPIGDFDGSKKEEYEEYMDELVIGEDDMVDDQFTEKAERPVLTKEEMDGLAKRFAKEVFPNGLEGGVGGVEGTKASMASLQAYLLNYKESPNQAVEEAGAWAKSMEKGELMLRSPGLAELEG